MVRPHSGSPRSKPRPFSDGYHSEHHGDRFGPSSRSQRGFRGSSGKPPHSWRENSGGPHPYKRPPLMGEPRERPHGHWTPQNPDNFRSQDSQRGRRRPSPPRSNRPPPVQHRMSPHGPSHGPPAHHRPPPFHRSHSGHVSPSPRRFNGPPPDRRGPSPHGNYRPPQRHRSPAHEQDRGWGPERPLSPRERPFNRHRWNGPGGFHHPNGEARFSGSPHRKPREFHERSSYPERWSAERDPRKLRGEFGRERGRERPGHHAPAWAHREGGNPHPRPPFRSPSWKSGPPSSSDSSSRFLPPLRPQERPVMRPLKRLGRPLSSASMEHGPPKRFRKELLVRPLPPRGFGGRGLSLKDKSRILKGRKFRAESVARFKLPPPKPRLSEQDQKASKHEEDSGSPPRSKILLKKTAKRPMPRRSSSDLDSKSTDPERDSETQVESRRSVRAHSSSPLDRHLTRDLVVVSHWEAGPRPSSSPTPKDRSLWKDRPSRSKTGSHESLTLSERFGKLQSPGCSPREQKERRMMGGPGKPFRKPGPFQATIIPRPPLHQKPVFRKSQSIMSKYRNLQSLRHKAPPHPRQATSYRRW
ncbi:basic salivary proline-rich protein 2 isoform X2 [Hoplias malabaricus]|uniref:basic salivary proline-rich protein 2 isoform X2 n=1 Tax=Hoplias malabaricus TaxID=27720 RepID=UPI0034632B61